jgi:ABC-2 type transport system permease protein
MNDTTLTAPPSDPSILAARDGSLVQDTWAMAVRHLRALWRQPWFVGVTLVQPVIWLLIFGSLFGSAVEIPGFEGDGTYIDYLAPGIVVMVALFTSGWVGMSLIQDLQRGVADRFLVTPVRRGALIAGGVVQNAIVLAVQSSLIVGMALVAGASFDNGAGGVLALYGVAILLGSALAGWSNAVALLTRTEESLIGAVTFLVTPLAFLSTMFLPAELMPGWIRTAARLNPVNWAVEAGREATTAGADWSFVAVRAGALAALTALTLVWASSALRAYQRST